MPLFPRVKAEEAELVDPQVTLRAKCAEKPECQEFKEKFDACETRVRSRKKVRSYFTLDRVIYSYVEFLFFHDMSKRKYQFINSIQHFMSGFSCECSWVLR